VTTSFSLRFVDEKTGNYKPVSGIAVSLSNEAHGTPIPVEQCTEVDNSTTYSYCVETPDNIRLRVEQGGMLLFEHTVKVNMDIQFDVSSPETAFVGDTVIASIAIMHGTSTLPVDKRFLQYIVETPRCEQVPVVHTSAGNGMEFQYCPREPGAHRVAILFLGNPLAEHETVVQPRFRGVLELGDSASVGTDIPLCVSCTDSKSGEKKQISPSSFLIERQGQPVDSSIFSMSNGATEDEFLVKFLEPGSFHVSLRHEQESLASATLEVTPEKKENLYFSVIASIGIVGAVSRITVQPLLVVGNMLEKQKEKADQISVQVTDPLGVSVPVTSRSANRTEFTARVEGCHVVNVRHGKEDVLQGKCHVTQDGNLSHFAIIDDSLGACHELKIPRRVTTNGEAFVEHTESPLKSPRPQLPDEMCSQLAIAALAPNGEEVVLSSSEGGSYALPPGPTGQHTLMVKCGERALVAVPVFFDGAEATAVATAETTAETTAVEKISFTFSIFNRAVDLSSRICLSFMSETGEVVPANPENVRITSPGGSSVSVACDANPQPGFLDDSDHFLFTACEEGTHCVIFRYKGQELQRVSFNVPKHHGIDTSVITGSLTQPTINVVVEATTVENCGRLWVSPPNLDPSKLQVGVLREGNLVAMERSGVGELLYFPTNAGVHSVIVAYDREMLSSFPISVTRPVPVGYHLVVHSSSVGEEAGLLLTLVDCTTGEPLPVANHVVRIIQPDGLDLSAERTFQDDFGTLTYTYTPHTAGRHRVVVYYIQEIVVEVETSVTQERSKNYHVEALDSHTGYRCELDYKDEFINRETPFSLSLSDVKTGRPLPTSNVTASVCDPNGVPTELVQNLGNSFAFFPSQVGQHTLAVTGGDALLLSVVVNISDPHVTYSCSMSGNASAVNGVAAISASVFEFATAEWHNISHRDVALVGPRGGEISLQQAGPGSFVYSPPEAGMYVATLMWDGAELGTLEIPVSKWESDSRKVYLFNSYLASKGILHIPKVHPGVPAKVAIEISDAKSGEPLGNDELAMYRLEISPLSSECSAPLVCPLDGRSTLLLFSVLVHSPGSYAFRVLNESKEMASIMTDVADPADVVCCTFHVPEAVVAGATGVLQLDYHDAKLGSDERIKSDSLGVSSEDGTVLPLTQQGSSAYLFAPRVAGTHYFLFRSSHRTIVRVPLEVLPRDAAHGLQSLTVGTDGGVCCYLEADVGEDEISVTVVLRDSQSGEPLPDEDFSYCRVVVQSPFQKPVDIHTSMKNHCHSFAMTDVGVYHVRCLFQDDEVGTLQVPVPPKEDAHANLRTILEVAECSVQSPLRARAIVINSDTARQLVSSEYRLLIRLPDGSTVYMGTGSGSADFAYLPYQEGVHQVAISCQGTELASLDVRVWEKNSPAVRVTSRNELCGFVIDFSCDEALVVGTTATAQLAISNLDGKAVRAAEAKDIQVFTQIEGGTRSMVVRPSGGSECYITPTRPGQCMVEVMRKSEKFPMLVAHMAVRRQALPRACLLVSVDQDARVGWAYPDLVAETEDGTVLPVSSTSVSVLSESERATLWRAEGADIRRGPRPLPAYGFTVADAATKLECLVRYAGVELCPLAADLAMGSPGRTLFWLQDSGGTSLCAETPTVMVRGEAACVRWGCSGETARCRILGPDGEVVPVEESTEGGGRTLVTVTPAVAGEYGLEFATGRGDCIVAPLPCVSGQLGCRWVTNGAIVEGREARLGVSLSGDNASDNSQMLRRLVLHALCEVTSAGGPGRVVRPEPRGADEGGGGPRHMVRLTPERAGPLRAELRLAQLALVGAETTLNVEDGGANVRAGIVCASPAHVGRPHELRVTLSGATAAEEAALRVQVKEPDGRLRDVGRGLTASFVPAVPGVHAVRVLGRGKRLASKLVTAVHHENDLECRARVLPVAPVEGEELTVSVGLRNVRSGMVVLLREEDVTVVGPTGVRLVPTRVDVPEEGGLAEPAGALTQRQTADALTVYHGKLSARARVTRKASGRLGSSRSRGRAAVMGAALVLPGVGPTPRRSAGGKQLSAIPPLRAPPVDLPPPPSPARGSVPPPLPTNVVLPPPPVAGGEVPKSLPPPLGGGTAGSVVPPALGRLPVARSSDLVLHLTPGAGGGHQVRVRFRGVPVHTEAFVVGGAAEDPLRHAAPASVPIAAAGGPVPEVGFDNPAARGKRKSIVQIAQDIPRKGAGVRIDGKGETKPALERETTYTVRAEEVESGAVVAASRLKKCTTIRVMSPSDQTCQRKVVASEDDRLLSVGFTPHEPGKHVIEIFSQAPDIWTDMSQRAGNTLVARFAVLASDARGGAAAAEAEADGRCVHIWTAAEDEILSKYGLGGVMFRIPMEEDDAGGRQLGSIKEELNEQIMRRATEVEGLAMVQLDTLREWLAGFEFYAELDNRKQVQLMGRELLAQYEHGLMKARRMAVYKDGGRDRRPEKKGEKKGEKKRIDMTRRMSLAGRSSRRESLVTGGGGGAAGGGAVVPQGSIYAPHVNVKVSKDQSTSKNEQEGRTVVQLLYRMGPNRWTFDIVYPSSRIYVGGKLEVNIKVKDPQNKDRPVENLGGARLEAHITAPNQEEFHCRATRSFVQDGMYVAQFIPLLFSFGKK